VFARVVFPWLLAVPQAVQLFLHAVCFGLPLGLLYAAAELDAHPAPQLPVAIARRGAASIRRPRRSRPPS
jgi:hypothetical protein